MAGNSVKRGKYSIGPAKLPPCKNITSDYDSATKDESSTNRRNAKFSSSNKNRETDKIMYRANASKDKKGSCRANANGGKRSRSSNRRCSL